MAFDNLQFDEALKKKYDIMQQNANTAAADLATKERIASLQEAGATGRAELNAGTQRDIAAMGDASLLERAKLNSQTQTGIAGAENALGRDRLAQQDRQFGAQIGLDTAKAQDASSLARAQATLPEAGRPIVDSVTGKVTEWQKSPGLSPTDLGPSSLGKLPAYAPGGLSADDEAARARRKATLGL